MEAFGSAGGYWLQQALNALFLACIYSLLATAYALLQGLTNRIILSFGDVATLGAYAAVSVAMWALLRGGGGAMVLLPAMLIACVASAAFGRFSYTAMYRPLMASPGQAVMIASIGVSIVIQEGLRLNTGSRDLWLPPLFGGTLEIAAGAYPVTVGFTQITAAAISIAALLGLQLVLRWTRAGRLWRAVSENPRLAALSGVNADAVYRWSFIAASGLAGMAGSILATAYGGVSFVMGLVLGFKAMFAAIIGGFGTLEGALAGGILLAILETGWTALFPAAYRDAAIFAIIILVLIVKPEGLFGHVLKRDSV